MFCLLLPSNAILNEILQVKDITGSNCEMLKRPAIGVSYSCEILTDLDLLKKGKDFKKLYRTLLESMKGTGYDSWNDIKANLEEGNFRCDELARDEDSVKKAAKALSDIAVAASKNMEAIKTCMFESHAQLIITSELYKLACLSNGWASYKNELKGDTKVCLHSVSNQLIHLLFCFVICVLRR